MCIRDRVSDPWHQISNLGPRKALKFGELQPSVQRGWWQIDAIAGRMVAAAGRPLGLANLGVPGSEPGGRESVMSEREPRCPAHRLGPFCEGAPNINFRKKGWFPPSTGGGTRRAHYGGSAQLYGRLSGGTFRLGAARSCPHSGMPGPMWHTLGI